MDKWVHGEMGTWTNGYMDKWVHGQMGTHTHYVKSIIDVSYYLMIKVISTQLKHSVNLYGFLKLEV